MEKRIKMKYYKNPKSINWDIVADYESDDQTVTLFDFTGKKIANLIYPQFTKVEFDHFKTKEETK
jgi:hypothetical protein